MTKAQHVISLSIPVNSQFSNSDIEPYLVENKKLQGVGIEYFYRYGWFYIGIEGNYFKHSFTTTLESFKGLDYTNSAYDLAPLLGVVLFDSLYIDGSIGAGNNVLSCDNQECKNFFVANDGEDESSLYSIGLGVSYAVSRHLS